MRTLLALVMVMGFFPVSAQFSGDFFDYANFEYTTPAEGMWHVEAEPGRGVTIENQGGRLLLTFFGYAENGDSQWWQGVGVSQEGLFSNIYTGEFATGRNGQCAGCDYTFPELDESGSLGLFTISFSDANHAVMNWKGKDLNLTKYYFGYTDTLDRLRGFWLFKSFNMMGVPISTGYSVINNRKTINDRDILISESISFEGTYKAATIFTNEAGEEIIVLADGRSDIIYGHDYMIYAFRLDHTIGRGGFGNDIDTGRYLYGDTMTKDPVNSAPFGPFYAYRVMDAYQSEPYYNWYTSMNSMSFFKKQTMSNKTVSFSREVATLNKDGFQPQPLSEELLSTMDFLVGVLSQAELHF